MGRFRFNGASMVLVDFACLGLLVGSLKVVYGWAHLFSGLEEGTSKGCPASLALGVLGVGFWCVDARS